MKKEKQKTREGEKKDAVAVKRVSRKIKIKAIERQLERDLRRKEAGRGEEEGHAEEKHSTGKGERLSIKETESRQIILLIAGLVILFAVTMSFVYIYTHASNFMYKGMKFQKISLEGINAYQTILTFSRGGQSLKYAHVFRYDPRKLDSIDTNASMVLRVKGFVTSEPKVSDCYGSSLAFVELGTVLGALGMSVRGATTSAELAEENNLLHVNCTNAKGSTVIVLQTSDKNSITQNGECYVLNISQCRTLEVTERFVLEMLSQLIKKSEKK